MLKSDLQKWFESRPAISVRQFGIECGYVDGQYFRVYIKKPAEPGEIVSKTVLSKIEPMLKHYGFSYSDARNAEILKQ